MNKIYIILFLVFYLFQNVEANNLFYLDNGQVLEGRLLKSEDNVIYALSSFGKVILEKSKIVKITDKKGNIISDNKDKLEKSEDDCIKCLDPIEHIVTKDMFFGLNLITDVTELRNKVRQGDTDSTILLALYYYNGEKVRQDYDEAFRLFQKKSEDRLCQYYRAVCYEKGYGTQINIDRALYLYKKCYDTKAWYAGYNYALLLAKTGNVNFAKEVVEDTIREIDDFLARDRFYSVKRSPQFQKIINSKLKILQGRLNNI